MNNFISVLNAMDCFQVNAISVDFDCQATELIGMSQGIVVIHRIDSMEKLAELAVV